MGFANLNHCLDHCYDGISISSKPGVYFCGAFSVITAGGGLIFSLKTLYHIFHYCHSKQERDRELLPILSNREISDSYSEKENALFSGGMTCVFFVTAVAMAIFVVLAREAFVSCENRCHDLFG